jgi:hypothetical protein
VLNVVPADKGNAAVVLETSDYNRKIAALLEDKAYKKLKMDPTESLETKHVSVCSHLLTLVPRSRIFLP